MAKHATHDDARTGLPTEQGEAQKAGAAAASLAAAADSDDVDSSLFAAWLVPAAVVSAILLLGFLLLYFVGLFPVPATDTGEKTLAAALVLIGTLLTASVSLIGIVIKSSVDNRTARFARIEALRQAALASEGEHRNRVDTVIRAIGLLGGNGENATKHQISGALLALISLGEYDLPSHWRLSCGLMTWSLAELSLGL